VSTGRAASIHDRLLAHAKRNGEDFTLTLTRYGLERFLYRLGRSTHRSRFVLKGALLLDLWFHAPMRPTRDADLLGIDALDAESMTHVIAEVCNVDADDGLEFDIESIRVAPIRDDTLHGGLRAKLVARLGAARCPIQLDVGFGDAITPDPQEVEYPTILSDVPAPSLFAYPQETVIAEKLEAIAHLGMANSRMKDYFDLFVLSRHASPDHEQMTAAIEATFSGRGTRLPVKLPIGLTPQFAEDRQKKTQWAAFLSRSRLDAPPLSEVVVRIVAIYGPHLLHAGTR